MRRMTMNRGMTKRLSCRAFLLFALCAILTNAAHATPVGPMNYQGRLLDDAGIPVTGSYNFVVKIYNAPTNGTLKYQESINSVAVEDGVYAFKIGLGPKTGGDSLWDINLWQLNLNSLYLEITINGETLTPRHELTSAPHAYTATLALSADALGNKTAAEFDNILEGVCVSGQGKWLDLLNKCLGIGAVVTNETLATMMQTPDTNFKSLNLTAADLTGSQFDGVSFSETVFKEATVEAAGLEGADLGGVVMDDVTFTGSPQTPSNMNLSYATFKNLNMSKWNLSSATLNNFSAANLSACPAALPVDWVCVAQHNPADGKYILLGPGVNMSVTSAAKVDTFGTNTLDVHRNIFDNKNLSYANFQGISLNKQTFQDANLSSANFSYTRMKRVFLFGTNLTNTSFSHADMNWIYFGAGTVINGTNFSEASIINAGMDTNVNNANFSYAIIDDINFQDVSNTSFVELLGKRISFKNLTGPIDFTNALLLSENGINIHFREAISGSLIFENLGGNGILEFNYPVPSSTVFNGGEFGIIGNISGVTISNALIDTVLRHTGIGMQEGPTLHNVTLRGINFGPGGTNTSSGPNMRYTTFTGTCSVENSFTDMGYVDLTGTDFGNCLPYINENVSWMFTTCPNGENYSLGSNPASCLPDQMTPAAGP